MILITFKMEDFDVALAVLRKVIRIAFIDREDSILGIYEEDLDIAQDALDANYMNYNVEDPTLA